MRHTKQATTLRPLDATLQARINESVLKRLRNKLEAEGHEMTEWLREIAELHLKGELSRSADATTDGLVNCDQNELVEKLAVCVREVESLKSSLLDVQNRMRADLGQFFIALLCNPTLLPDGMTLSESDIGHLLSCMFPDLTAGGNNA